MSVIARAIYLRTARSKKKWHSSSSSSSKRTKKFFFNDQKVGMLLQKRRDTRGVWISSMRKSIYLLTTTPTSHTHRFHLLPLATPTSFSPHPYIPPTLHNCHPYFEVWMTIVEWVECVGVASGCGEQEVGVASGSGWNLWVWLLGVVVRRYIDFLILLIPTPLVSLLFCSSIPTFCS